MSLSLVLLGTGRLALPVFEALCQSQHRTAAVVTQPDKRGRGHHHHTNPVKELAEEYDVPVLQPENVNAPASLDGLRALDPDLLVVAAYGQFLSNKLLTLAPHGAINVHASLLPKYRGATPIHRAILNGDAETGVTVIQLVRELDAGPMLGSVRTRIKPKETTGELEERLAELAVPVTLRVIDEIEAGVAVRQPQDESQATRAPRLSKQDGAVDWSRSAVEIERHVRAMQPWPKPFTYLHQPGRSLLRLILVQTEPSDEDQGVIQPPGTVREVSNDRLHVQTGSGLLDVLAWQPEGKRAMPLVEFLRGHPVNAGDRLGSNRVQ